MDIRKKAIENYLEGKYCLAIKQYLELINSKKEVFSEDYYNLGTCYIKSKDYYNAIKFLNYSLYSGYNRKGAVLHNLAYCYTSIQNYEEALLCAKNALREDPTDTSLEKSIKLLNERINEKKENKTNKTIDKESIKKIVKKKIIYVIYFKANYGFDVYSYIYDNNDDVSENFIKHIMCKRMNTKKYEGCKDQLLKKYNTEKYIILD